MTLSQLAKASVLVLKRTCRLPGVPSLSGEKVVSQLLSAVLPLFLIVQIGATMLMEVRSGLSAEQSALKNFTILAQSRVDVVRDPLWDLRYDRIGGILAELVARDGVVSAYVEDDTGAVVSQAGEFPAPADARSLSVDIHHDIASRRLLAGKLVIAYRMATMFEDFWRKYTPVLFVGGLAAVALALGLRAAAQNVIGAPLNAMLSAIQWTRANDLRFRKVEVGANNEFADLAKAFNELVDAGEEAKKTLERQATHDALTGLPNRRLLPAQLEAATQGAGRGVAFYFVDLDDFKSINDTFGHEAGDQYLVHIAHRLQSCMEAGYWVARFGGDEFIVIQIDAEGEEAARRFAERLLEAIAEPVELIGKSITPRASIGIAIRRSDDPEILNLPALADIALYHAKSLRTGSIAVLNSVLLRKYARRRELELALPVAFKQKQFDVWFQCQFDVRKGVVCGLEALVRWRHPEYGVVSPVEFVPLIEQSGLSAMLARFVFERVCEARLALIARGFHHVAVAMNVSPHELTDFSFCEAMQTMASRHELPLTGIEIEITEGLLINNVARTLEALARIRAAGVSVALDDFGQGYSSLAYLRRFPLDKLKIDKVFIRDVPENEDDLAILEIIVDLANKLRLSVVAEGVEREEQAQVLRRLGVDLGQGYLFHRPQPLADVLAFLQAGDGSFIEEVRAAS